MAGKIIKMPTYYMIVTSFNSYLFIFFSQAHYKGGKVAKLYVQWNKILAEAFKFPAFKKFRIFRIFRIILFLCNVDG